MRNKILCWISMVCLVYLSFTCQKSYATHIRAGEIIAERISAISITYRFTIIGYTDEGSIVPFGNGVLKLGDGREVRLSDNLFTKTIIGDEVAKNTFSIEHTYPAPGQYTISYKENNRNADILTMSNSINTPFYVETVLNIDPSLGINNTPILLIPPIDRATTDQIFYHNPGAYDIDGDSLAYRLVLNKQDEDVPVDDFRMPNDPEYYADYSTGNSTQDGPPVYTLDSITGDLVWDAPGTCGEYNTAFIVEEWREVNGEWFFLGYVTRDMQIIVECDDNRPPVLEIPNDTCVVAGALLETIVKATDPDGDDVQMEAFGGIFEYGTSKASFLPFPITLQPTVPDPAQLFFRWQTQCSYIRERPYKVWFKVSDPFSVNDPSLATFRLWNITVVGPPPEGLAAQALPGKKARLSWDSYECNNASKIQVWRRLNSYEFTPGNCETGIPEGAGYELIEELDADATSFVDDNDGDRLDVGSTYCYRLVAVFPKPAGGESYASEEVCVTMKVDAPLITKVDVRTTDERNGQIAIQWMEPFEIDTILYPPPYTYQLGRAEGFKGSANLRKFSKTQDTLYFDNGLNTLNKTYNYRVYIYDANDELVDSSAVASQVRLDVFSNVGGLKLNWQASVPWSNKIADHPWHLIYRNHLDPSDNDRLVLYDSVQVMGNDFRYVDNGREEPLSSELEYCYFVTTKGGYAIEQVERPLINRSQIICAKPNDSIPPCPPVNVSVSNLQVEECKEFLDNKPCDFTDFFNVVAWQKGQVAGGCEVNDILLYEIFYSPDGLNGEFLKVGETSDTTFTHEGLTSFKGCYKIRALDRSENFSEFSEPFCIDNCPFYELPNVFTPNNDGSNDVLQPFDNPLSRCPRFVKQVEIIIYNRWGKEVHRYDSEGTENIYINWDGKNDSGKRLATGIYYYVLNVTFDVLDEDKREVEYKGWVHLMY